MGWFGGGGGSSDETSSNEHSFSGGDLGGYDDALSGGGTGDMSLQALAQELQSQMLVQLAIQQIAGKAFDKCVTGTPKDSTLSGREVSCIHAVTYKYLDSKTYLVNRMQKKQQQASSQQGGY
jgi:hypothetical protein